MALPNGIKAAFAAVAAAALFVVPFAAGYAAGNMTSGPTNNTHSTHRTDTPHTKPAPRKPSVNDYSWDDHLEPI